MFLVRRLEDGTMRTVTARGSTRNAMRVFVARYGPPVGEVFGVKLRGEDEWSYFKTTSSGIRQVTS
jgi:hypothetical protein